MRDLTTTNLNERQFFENKFREFKEYLEKRGNLKAGAVRTLLTPVASFFSRNGLQLNLKRGDWEKHVATAGNTEVQVDQGRRQSDVCAWQLERPQFTVSFVSEWTK